MIIKLLPMKLKFLLFAFLSVILLKSSFAQEEEGALQIKLEKEQYSYKIYPVGENGFLLGSYDDTNKKSKQYNFIKYDSDLKQDKTYKLNLVKGHTVCFAKYVGGKYFYVIAGTDLNYTMSAGEGAAFKEFICYRIDLTNMSAKSINLNYKTAFHIRDLNEADGKVLLSGITALSNKDLQRKVCYSVLLCYIPLIFYKPEGNPVLIKLDFEKKSGNKKEFEYNKAKNTYTDILSVDYIDTLGNVDLLLYSYTKKIRKVFFKSIINDKAGKEVELKFAGTKTALSGKIFTKNENDKYIAGLIGDTKKKNAQYGTFAKSNGVYLACVKNGKVVYNKSNNFTDFKNFKFLSVKGQKIAKKREKKDKDYNASIVSITQYITERENYILVMGEAFYPTYRTETYVTIDSRGIASVRTRTVFDGFQWIGGYVIAYDKNGKMIWENGMRFKETVKSYYAKKRMVFAENDNGDIEITCANNKTIQTKTIHEDGKADDDKFIEIKTAEGGKKMASKRDENLGTNVEPWYDNFYLAYNYQMIKKDKKEKGDKFKYYLNVNKLNMTND